MKQSLEFGLELAQRATFKQLLWFCVRVARFFALVLNSDARDYADEITWNCISAATALQ